MLNEPFLVIGHRGAAAHLPENTIQSFYKAAELGASWVELDVQPLKDGTLVVFHDKFLRRMTGRLGQINNLKYQDLAKFKIKKKFTIPTLKEALAVIKAQNLGVYVEVKSKDVTCVPRILEEVSNSETSNVISSFYPHILEETRSLGWSGTTMALLETYSRSSLDFSQRHEQIGIAGKMLRTKHTENFILEKRKLFCYTINDLTEIKRIKTMGLAGVFTDYPEINHMMESTP